MIDPYVLDQIGEDEDAYESASKKNKKRLKMLLETTAMIKAMIGGGYDEENFCQFEEEILQP